MGPLAAGMLSAPSLFDCAASPASVDSNESLVRSLQERHCCVWCRCPRRCGYAKALLQTRVGSLRAPCGATREREHARVRCRVAPSHVSTVPCFWTVRGCGLLGDALRGILFLSLALLSSPRGVLDRSHHLLDHWPCQFPLGVLVARFPESWPASLPCAS